MKILFAVLFFCAPLVCSAQGGDDMREFYSSTTAATAQQLKMMDKQLAAVHPVTKTITGKQYAHCKLLCYAKGQSLRKITVTRQIQSNKYVADYYFSGGWPLYAEERNLTKHSVEKFYCSKSDLMLRIDARGHYLTVSDKATSRRWKAMLSDIHRWEAMLKMKEQAINADMVKLK